MHVCSFDALRTQNFQPFHAFAHSTPAPPVGVHLGAQRACGSLPSLLFEQGFLGRLAGTRRTSSPPAGPGPGASSPAVIGTDALSGP